MNPIDADQFHAALLKLQALEKAVDVILETISGTSWMNSMRAGELRASIHNIKLEYPPVARDERST